MAQQSGERYRVYVGTYTHASGGAPDSATRSEGIYICRMDGSTGALELTGMAKGIVNPSFLAVHPDRRFLYAVSEVWETDGRTGGAVSAFSIDGATGDLAPLNSRPSGGGLTCHLGLDRTGRLLMATNYGTGSVAVLPVRSDGGLDEASQLLHHEGSGVNADRQEGPHPHSIAVDAANHYAFVPDLGLDRVAVYALDGRTGRLTSSPERSASLKPGAGPRHFDFHPTGRFMFVINELDSTVTAFAYDADNGTLRGLQTLSTLPAGFAGSNGPADIHVSPSGSFLYGSNRGHDSFVIFAIDQATGELTYVGNQPTGGGRPRNFAIDPTGRFLLAANQDSDSIVTFRIDERSGELDPTGDVADVPSPSCLKFVPIQ